MVVLLPDTTMNYNNEGGVLVLKAMYPGDANSYHSTCIRLQRCFFSRLRRDRYEVEGTTLITDTWLQHLGHTHTLNTTVVRTERVLV